MASRLVNTFLISTASYTCTLLWAIVINVFILNNWHLVKNHTPTRSFVRLWWNSCLGIIKEEFEDTNGGDQNP